MAIPRPAASTFGQGRQLLLCEFHMDTSNTPTAQIFIVGLSSRGTALCRDGGSLGFACARNSLAPLMGSPNQKIGGNAKLRPDTADHRDRERPLARHNLRNTRPAADDRLEILSRQPLLLHPEPYGSHRIRSVNDVMLRFVGVYQSCQNSQFLACRRIWRRPHEFPNPRNRCRMIFLSPDRMNWHTVVSHRS